MKKLILFLSTFIFGALSLFNGYIANAANDINGGTQNGQQTHDMTIDEGLEILDLDPNDFRYKEIIKCDLTTDLTKYFGVNGIKDKTPVEVIGITESYEYTETSGYIDTYVYLYSPYALDILGDITPFTSYYSSCAIMFYLNEDKMDLSSGDGWWLGVHNSYQDMDAVMQYFETNLLRAHVKSEHEPNSISQGVTRLRFRIYTADDLTKERNYYLEKVVYDYETIDGELISSNCTPSFNASFSAIKDDGNVDTDKEYDEEFTDTTIFQVKNKSIICVEAKHFIHVEFRDWWPNFLDYYRSYSFILLRNAKTGEFIDNCQAMQIDFKLEGDEQYRSIKKDNLGDRSTFKIGNILSETGQFQDTGDKDLEYFKENVEPNLSSPYQYEEYPQYKWMWNFHLIECKTVYIWTEVEAGTVVQGSCYANGMHPEYDENGNCLGVFDYKGNKVEGYKVGASGVITEEDGSYVDPSGSKTEYNEMEIVTPLPLPGNSNDKEDGILDRIVSWWNEKVKPFFEQYKYWIVGIGTGVIILYFASNIRKKK